MRGIAILVTCDYSDNPHLELPATNRDADEMRKTFEVLGYDIHERRNENVTKDKIMTLLEDFHQYLQRYKGKLTNQDGSEKVIAFAFSGHGKPDDKNDKDSMCLLTYDEENLSLKGDIMSLFIGIPRVFEIPRLFFIDACRGEEKLVDEAIGKAAVEDVGNYRIDYATFQDHMAYIIGSDYKWMFQLAYQLRDEKNKSKSFQDIAAIVKKSVQEGGGPLQQCESIDRLITGPLNLCPK